MKITLTLLFQAPKIETLLQNFALCIFWKSFENSNKGTNTETSLMLKIFPKQWTWCLSIQCNRKLFTRKNHHVCLKSFSVKLLYAQKVLKLPNLTVQNFCFKVSNNKKIFTYQIDPIKKCRGRRDMLPHICKEKGMDLY